MKETEKFISSHTPRLCYVDADYLDYLRNIDNRVSTKSKRKFLVLTIKINGLIYAVPLTSQTSEKRFRDRKKERANSVTTKIMDGGTEIANLLYNNMIPVDNSLLTDFIIDPLLKSYEAMEERFIRKKYDTICKKAKAVYLKRYDSSHREYQFLTKICCDFRVLEQALERYMTVKDL